MADKLLSTISILENFPTGQFSKGQVLKVYFDTVTRNRFVKITTSSGTYNLPESSSTTLLSPSEIIKSRFDKETGEIITETEIVRYWSRSDTGYKYSRTTVEPTTASEGVEIVYSFPTSRNFPYNLEKKTSVTIPRLDAPPPTDDIELNIISTTVATTKTAADGVIEVQANGTNTPFTYYDIDPSEGGAAKGSGTFNGLTTGSYTFYAKDSKGFQTSVTGTVGYLEVPDVEPNSTLIDNYGVRWTHSQLTYDGETYKTDIFERDYSGSPSEVIGADTPFSLTRRTEGDSFVDMHILYSSAQVNFVLETENQFRDIILGDDKKFIVLRSKYNGSTYDTEWIGFVNPESYQDVLFQEPYYVSIEASDRLGDLKYFKFYNGNNDSENIITGRYSQLQVLSICLNKLLYSHGYRIACNIFASGHTKTSRTPLDQTYVDTRKYLDNDDATDCEQVVLDILTTYQAVLFCEGSYWYIVRKDEWTNTSISYVEYNKALSVVTTGSWSPRVSFDSPTASNRAVWINGAQSRVYAPPYSNVFLNIETGLVENQSLTPAFNLTNAVFGSSGFSGFGKWILYAIDDTVDINTLRSINNGEEVGWEIGIQASINSSTYAQFNGTIDYSGGDEISIKASFDIFGYYESDDIFGMPRIDEYPPYLQFKWSLKIGNKWITPSGKYSTTEKLNFHYFQQGQTNIFEKIINAPNDGTTANSYQLRFYAVDISEADFGVDYNSLSAGDADVVSAFNKVKAIRNAISIAGGTDYKVKNVRKAGDRLVFRVGNDFYYYELSYAASRVSDSIDKIMVSDYNPQTVPYAWELVSQVNLPYIGISEGSSFREYCVDQDCNIIRNGLVTTTVFKEMTMKLEPVGGSLKENIVIEKPANELNNVDKEFSIKSFDLGTLNKSLYRNYLTLLNGTATKNWKPVGGGRTTSIQNHALAFLSKYTRTPKSRVNGNFRVDGVNFTTINVLVDTNDGSKLYISTGVSSDLKLQEFSGELLEIASGDDVTISAFSDGFQQSSIR